MKLICKNDDSDFGGNNFIKNNEYETEYDEHFFYLKVYYENKESSEQDEYGFRSYRIFSFDINNKFFQPPKVRYNYHFKSEGSQIEDYFYTTNKEIRKLKLQKLKL